MKFRKHTAATFAALCAATVLGAPVQAQEVIKLGLSVPFGGAGANWGKGSVLMCEEAARNVNQGGG
ncbi:MAG: amino acid ABC transporter substrate-binding protein, partial [Burkholderiales bacterium]